MSEATKLYYNARIYTMNDAAPTASALVVGTDGTLVFVGDAGEAQHRYPEAAAEDLQGRWVLPGLVDAHVHLLMYGKKLTTIDPTGKDRLWIIRQVKEAASNTPPGAWILGSWGWNNEHWEDTSFPTREELDAVCSDHPVFLPKYDGHGAWVNSMALQLAGIDDDTPTPIGGEIVRDASGYATGYLTGRAKALVEDRIPPMPEHEIDRALLEAQQQLFAYGVTAIQEAMTAPEVYNALERLYAKGFYKLRVNAALPLNMDTLQDVAQQARISEGPKVGMYGGRFSCRTCKVLVDGSISSHTAALREPFSDRPGHYGQLNFTEEQLTRLLRWTLDAGMQPMAHCIGDAASEQYIRVISTLLPGDASARRVRMEHFHVSVQDLLELLAAKGILLSVQPTHAPMNPSTVKLRLGDRVQIVYAHKRELEHCGQLALGSDAPVSEPNPFYNIYAAVTRRGPNGLPKDGFIPEQAITREQALKASTLWAQYAQFGEEQCGSLQAGKAADFVVIDEDILTCPEERIPYIKVRRTVLAGEEVYRTP